MNSPKALQAYNELELKLGIKSSLPNIKSTLALVILLWECADHPAELIYSTKSGNEIVLSDQLKQWIIDATADICEEDKISADDLINKINQNQIFKSQLEALIVAFELVWRIAKIRFVDRASTTDERTTVNGIKVRYPKKLNYTANLDIIHSLICNDLQAYFRVLLHWMKFNVNYDTDHEKALLHMLTVLSEGAVFKLTDNGKEVIFNQNGVYQKILETNESVDISGDSEPKGTLRIFRSLLSEGMNPYLHYSNGSVEITEHSTEKLEDYQKRVDTLFMLSSIRVSGADTVHSDEIQLVSSNLEKNRVTGGTNIILYGVPGAGKSWTIKHEYCNDENLMERLVFHPDYTYSDFVGQILPKIDDDGTVNYEFSPGPFTNLLRKAYINPDKMFYLIIEEINRGNAPAIFGDIFQLLDRDKNGKSEYEITNADIAKRVYLDGSHKVSIPSNMCILCTMNTSDQNVFTLDTAFQRRWSMRLIRNKFHDEEDERKFAETKILDTDVTWEKFFTEINSFILGKNIRMTSSEDKRLGTHFVSIDDLEEGKGDDKKLIERQNSRFPEKVLKYLWDDAFKFTKEDVFDLERVKSLEDVIDLFVSSSGNARFHVFKENIYNALVPKNNF